MKALIDCGATGEFIDHKFFRAHELQTYQLPHPIGLYNADRLPNEIGKITEAINLIVQYKGQRAGPSSTFRASATRLLSQDTPGLWSTTPISTGTPVKSN